MEQGVSSEEQQALWWQKGVVYQIYPPVALRRGTRALTMGSYQALDAVPDACFVYLRQAGQQRCLVALNFSSSEQTLRLTELGSAHLVLSTSLDREGACDLASLRLRGYEGCLFTLSDVQEV